MSKESKGINENFKYIYKESKRIINNLKCSILNKSHYF